MIICGLGWSNFSQQPGASQASNIMQQKTSATFAAFRKAAQEKQDRERALKEQQETMRLKKEMMERERQRKESEKRKEKEEEELLEATRRNHLSQQQQLQKNRLEDQFNAPSSSNR